VISVVGGSIEFDSDEPMNNYMKAKVFFNNISI